MPLNQRLHGKRGSVMIDVAGGTSYVTLADVNAWTLDMSTDRVVVAAFGDTNMQRVAGLPDFSGTLGAWWNAATSPAYFAAVLAGTPVGLKLIENTNDATVFHSGLANIDGSISVSATGAVSWTGKWDAASNWTMSP